VKNFSLSLGGPAPSTARDDAWCGVDEAVGRTSECGVRREALARSHTAFFSVTNFTLSPFLSKACAKLMKFAGTQQNKNKKKKTRFAGHRSQLTPSVSWDDHYSARMLVECAVTHCR